MTDKPKRKYTVTERVLAAALANLAKANAVSKAIRYRSTEPRLLACRSNLIRAIAARRADWSAGYAPSFRLGCYAMSLPRSLAAAGESEAEFDRHLELFARAFAPADAVEQKLVRAMAKVWWRRLRALRLQSRWEANWLEARLLHAVRFSDWADSDAERDLGTTAEVFGVFLHDMPLLDKLQRLNRRFERLARVLLERREDVDFKVEFWLRRHPSESRMGEQPEALLENPFLTPGGLERRLNARVRQPAVSEVGSWTWRTPDAAGFNADDGSASDADPFVLDDSSGGANDCSTARPSSSADARDAQPQHAAPGSEFAEHLRRIVRAFPKPGGKGRGSGDGSTVELRKLAALTWARQRVFGAEADCEAAFLQETLGDPAVGIARRTATLLTRLDGDLDFFTRVGWLRDSVSHALYQLHVKRYGRSAEIDEFKAGGREAAWEKHATGFLEAMDEAGKAVSGG